MCPNEALSYHKDEKSRAFLGRLQNKEHNTCLCLILAGKQAATGVDNDSVFSLWIVWIFQKKITKSAKINDVIFTVLPNSTPATDLNTTSKKIMCLIISDDWPIKMFVDQKNETNKQINKRQIYLISIFASSFKTKKHTNECTLLCESGVNVMKSLKFLLAELYGIGEFRWRLSTVCQKL